MIKTNIYLFIKLLKVSLLISLFIIAELTVSSCGMAGSLLGMTGEIAGSSNLYIGQIVCLYSRDGLGIKQNYIKNGIVLQDGDKGSVIATGNFRQGPDIYKYVDVKFYKGVTIRFADYRMGWAALYSSYECCDPAATLQSCN